MLVLLDSLGDVEQVQISC